jgi:LysR family transcriptional activator of nhaA
MVIEKRIRTQYNVKCVEPAERLTERIHAITVERRIRHPGVIAISEAGRNLLSGL